jgi:hypothetical protein
MRARREWLLFDDRGATWPTHSIEWQRRPSWVPHDADLVTGLIRNLGFVGGRRLGDNAAVRLHSPTVSQVALAAAFYWLADHAPRRVLIDLVGESRPAEVCTSAAAAIARLIAITRQRHSGQSAAASTPCSVDRASGATSRFCSVLGNLG